MHALDVDEKTAAKLEKECDENRSRVRAHHALQLLSRRGKPEEVVKLGCVWRNDRKQFEAAERKASAKHKVALRRYEAALERLRGTRGLPDEAALDKIQRYEAHLERGLYKALERLQTLQEARGAIPLSYKPAVALAVIQPAPETAEMGSLGSFAIEAPGMVNHVSVPPAAAQPTG